MSAAAPETSRRLMPWKDDSKPGPWNAPSGDSPPPPPREPGDKGERGGTAPSPGKGAGDRGSPWRSARVDREDPARPRRQAGAPPPRGPDLDELSRLLKARLTRALNGKPAPRLTPAVGLATVTALVAAWALTGLYRVQPGQQAVLFRFGAYAGLSGPGLGYHLPFPIGGVRKVSLAAVNRTDLGGASGEAAPPGGDQMLTRDGALVELRYSVEWRVSDPTAYLFHLADPEAALRLAAESAVRQAVGQASLQDVLESGPARVQARAAALVQAALDRQDAGVTVVDVQLRDVEPPQSAAAAYRDLAGARQDAEAAVADAQAYRTRALGEAHSEAARAVETARGYREQVTREAAGEADRFALIDAQYRRAPAATRQRIYIETMEHVLRASNKVVVDTQGRSTIALPPDLFRAHATPDAMAAHAAPSTPAPASPPAAAPAQSQPQAAPRPDGASQ